jgi:predicted lactoylglutathione lyase
MIINDKTFVMLSIHEKFQGFIKTPIADKNTTEAILSFACETKEEVETIATKAFAAGGKQVNDLEDHGMMVSWGFEDLDGHLWDLFWMNPEHIAKLTNTQH